MLHFKRILKFLLIITALCFGFYAGAQGGFKKRYLLSGTSGGNSRDALEAPNGNLVISGYTTDTITGVQKLTVMGTDSQGNPLWRKSYGHSKFTYNDNDLQTTGGTIRDASGYYQTMCATDTTGQNLGVLIRFNYNGDTLWQKIFRETAPKDVILQAICKSVDGGILLTGFSQDWTANTQACIIIKTDLNGNELWRQRISKAGKNVLDGKGIVQDNTSKRIIIIGYQYAGTSSNWDIGDNILILDSLGNKITQKSYTNRGILGGVIQTKDGNFVTCGVNDANSPWATNPRYRKVLIKFDTAGNKIWLKEYGIVASFTGLLSLHEAANGDLVLFGGLDTMYNNSLADIQKAQFLRTDQNGNLKFEKYIGRADADDQDEGIRSSHQLSSGGYLVSTYFPFLASKRPYSIIKLDSLGCDTAASYCGNPLALSEQFTGKKVLVYPNPASTMLNLEMDSQSATRLLIYNTLGQEVKQQDFDPGKSKILLNVSGWPNGVYFISTESREGRKLAQSFIISK